MGANISTAEDSRAAVASQHFPITALPKYHRKTLQCIHFNLRQNDSILNASIYVYAPKPYNPIMVSTLQQKLQHHRPGKN